MQVHMQMSVNLFLICDWFPLDWGILFHVFEILEQVWRKFGLHVVSENSFRFLKNVNSHSQSHDLKDGGWGRGHIR